MLLNAEKQSKGDTSTFRKFSLSRVNKSWLRIRVGFSLCPEARSSSEMMSSGNATCYYNNRSVAEPDHFCSFSNQDTCCPFGWECLSNGLCQTSDESEYAQGSCTDPGFKKCLSFCNYAQPGEWTVARRCEPASNSWCFTCALWDYDGPNCCDTNLTTALEPYPFTIGSLMQLPVDITSSTASISPVRELTSAPSSSSYPSTFLKSTSEASIETSTQISTTTSGALKSSPSTKPTNQSHSSKTDIEIGISVAVVMILLAVLAFFVFQNRRFRQRLLELREGPSAQKEIRTTVRRDNGNPPGELDITHYELTQQNAPQHELSGNEIHELFHRGIPEHNLNKDDSER